MQPFPRLRTRATRRRGTCHRTLPAILLLLVLPALPLGLSAPLQAQPPEADPEPYRDAIDRIDFLVGTWHGEGWSSTGPDQRKRFTSTEIVEERLGGSALLIEGIHHAVTEGDEAGEGPLIHHALATVTWSEADQEYRFVSALFNRDGGTFRGWVDEDGAFVWEIAMPERLMRYVIALDDRGRWVEDGKISLDGGESWFPFFHMTLERMED